MKASGANPSDLPAGLPVPEDDGGCAHLPGLRLPGLALPATSGRQVDLSELSGRTVVFCQAGSRRARLFLLVDDHSRLLVHGSWCSNENTRAGQQVLRAAIQRRDLPEQIYFDDADVVVMPTSA